MKKICLMLFTMIIVVCFVSVAFAGDTIKLSTTINNKDSKTRYEKGDTLVITLAVEEACPNFGFLMGTLEFNKNYLEYNRSNRLQIIEPSENGMDTGVYPQFLNVGLDDRDNQIIFWLEDSKNRMKDCKFAMVAFNVEQGFNIEDINFIYKDVKAGDYDQIVSFSVDDITASKVKINKESTAIEEQEPVNIKELTQEINESRKSISEYVNQGNDKVKEEEKKEEKKETKKYFWSNASDWAIEELEEANSKGLIPESFENQDFTKAITRKEFAAVAVKLYEKLTNSEAEKASKETFNDTEDEYVLKAYSLGITEGTSKEKALFSPNNEITREQMATMMLRAISKAGINTSIDLNSVTKFIDDDEMHDWSRAAIYYMSSNNIINGISTKENRYGVKNTAKIDQALAISLRTIKAVSK